MARPNYQAFVVSRDGTSILERVLLPLTRKANRQGLLKFEELQEFDGMLIKDRVIHMVGMRFSLDLVFLNKDGAIVKISRNVKPGLLLHGSIKANRTLEIAAGQAEQLALKIGDRLDWNPVSSDSRDQA